MLEEEHLRACLSQPSPSSVDPHCTGFRPIDVTRQTCERPYFVCAAVGQRFVVLTNVGVELLGVLAEAQLGTLGRKVRVLKVPEPQPGSLLRGMGCYRPTHLIELIVAR
jgi:hypothetical protein